jgi:predicted GIY-YIG superfamily endonuclease
LGKSITNRLSDRRVRTAPPGMHFRYTCRTTGKDRQLGLGPLHTIGLAEARTMARECREQLLMGGDPIKIGRAKLTEAPWQVAAEKFLSFIERGIKPSCYLYRHYHPNGDLLYVGVSLRAIERLEEHKRAGAAWLDQIHRIVIEPFETREEALAAEEAAIRVEFPGFNKANNRRGNLRREVARFRSEIPAKAGS